MVFSVLFFDKIKIDDPVGATSVHLVCGVFGTICVGLVRAGSFYPEYHRQRFVLRRRRRVCSWRSWRASSVLACLCSSFHLIFWKIIAATLGIRVSADEEIEGLDIGEHGNVAYPDFVTAGARGSSLMAESGRAVEAPGGYRAAELSKRTV